MGVVVVVEVGLGVGAPGVFYGEEETAEELAVRGVAYGKFLARDPLLAEAGDLAILGDFGWVAGDAVDPCVADLLSDDGEVVAMGVDGEGEVGERGGLDGGVGELGAETGVDGGDLGGGVGAVVVAAHLHGEGEVGAGDLEGAAVVVMVDDDDGLSGGVAPEEDAGDLGWSAGGVDADVQEFDAGGGEGTDEAAGVAGNVGHLGTDGAMAEARVERGGEG